MVYATRCFVAIVAMIIGVEEYGRGQVSQTASSQTSSPPTSMLSGRVVDGITGKPVPSAAVAVYGLSASVRASDSFVQYSDSTAGNRVIANNEGQFVIRDLPKGRYIFNVFADGYAPGGYGQSRPGGPTVSFDFDFDATRARTPLTIALWRTCVIEGVVTDEAGDPVAMAWVSPIRRMVVSGQPRWVYPGRGTSTDDRGVFRISGLPSGDYMVGIVQSSNTLPASIVDGLAAPVGSPSRSTVSIGVFADETISTSGMSFASLSVLANGFHVGNSVFQLNIPGSFERFMPPAPDDAGRLRIYPTTFAPGVTSSAAAQIFTLTPGAEINGINFQLRPVTTVAVAGTVTSPDGPVKNAGVVLLGASEALVTAGSDFPSAATLTDAAGAFRFLGVPSGQYIVHVLRAPRPSNMPSVSPNSVSVGGTGGVSTGVQTTNAAAATPLEHTYWADRSIVVGNDDLSDVSVNLQAGFSVSGSFAFVGKTPKPSAEQLAKMTVSLVPVSTIANARALPGPLPVLDGQSFRTPEYASGRYRIRIDQIPPGWVLQAALYEGRDISDEPLEVVDRNATSVAISLAESLGGFSGTVRDAEGQTSSTAEVLVFPADQMSWRKYGVSARRARTLRPTVLGTYVVSQIPPGEYFVVALDPKVIGDRQDPKLLESLVAAASRLRLGDGENKTLDLKVVSSIR